MKIHSSVFIFLLLFSCTSKDLSKRKEFKLLVSDTSNSFVRRNYSYLLAKTNTLNLSRLDKGVDSFELRLWSSLVMTDLSTLTILKYSDSCWHLTETRYWLSSVSDDQQYPILILDSSQTKKMNPSISFSAIIDSINLYDIKSLPSQNDIPNFIDRTADGTSYILEIATRNYYKNLWYRNPKSYKDNTHKKMIEILSFLQRNTGALVVN